MTTKLPTTEPKTAVPAASLSASDSTSVAAAFSVFFIRSCWHCGFLHPSLLSKLQMSIVDVLLHAVVQWRWSGFSNV